MTSPGGAPAAPSPRPGWVLALLVVLVVLEHVRAASGDAGFEHFEEIGRELRALGAGRARASSLVTGGGWLHPGMWWLAARAGLPWWEAQWIHALLDVAGLVGFWLLAPRSLPRTLVWATALLIAVDPILKVFLFENSAVAVAVTPPLLALLLGPLRGRRLLLACALVAVAVDLSLVLLPAVLGVAWVLVRSGAGRRAGLLAVAVALPLLPLAVAIPDPAAWLRAPTGGGGASGFEPGLVLDFLLWPSLALAVLGLAVGAPRLIPRPARDAALVWVLPCAAFLLLPLASGDRFHLAAAVAPLALFGGATLARLLARWEARGVPILVGLALVASAIGVARSGADWRGEEVPYRCAATDAGVCDPGDLRAVVEDLAVAGWAPTSHPGLTFAGSLSRCLAPVWDWEATAAGRDRSPDEEAPLVLVEDLPAELASGGVAVGDGLTAYRGARSGEGLWYLEVPPDAEEGPGFDVVFVRACPELHWRRHFREQDGGLWMLVDGQPSTDDTEGLETWALRAPRSGAERDDGAP